MTPPEPPWTDDQPWPPNPRPLPRVLRPLRNETVSSFIRRIAHANHARFPAFHDTLSRDPDGDWIVRLAALCSIPQRSLLYALPELHHQGRHGTWDLAPVPIPLPDPTINTVRPPCRYCARRHGADPEQAEVWTAHDHNVCPRHRLWIGPGANTPANQLDLTSTPRIVAAQARQRRIILQHGRPAAFNGYRLAHHAWHQLNELHGYTRDRDARLAALAPGRDPKTMPPHDPAIQAAAYPEVVALASILADRHWLPILRNPGKARYQRIADQINRVVTDEYQPPGPPHFLPELRRALITTDLDADDISPANKWIRRAARKHEEEQRRQRREMSAPR